MPINARTRSRRLYRLRTILLVVMLSVLVLPIASLFLFRFYENELVRRTEEQLIAQAAVIASTYRQLMNFQGVADTASSGSVDAWNARSRSASRLYYTPIDPKLDLSKQAILPRRADAIPAIVPASLRVKRVGQVMQNIMTNAQRYTLAGMRLLDVNGTVIAGRSEVGESLRHIAEVRRALRGNYSPAIRERISDQPQPPLASISRGTGIRVFIAFPIKHDNKVKGVVYLSRTPQNILKHMYQIRGKLILLGFVLIMVTGLLVLFISSRLSRPIRELIAQTQQVTKGEQHTVSLLHQPGTYELAQLSGSFTEMSEALKERSMYIDRFASHVSHEFKTPLTSMQGALELLQEHADDMPHEQRQRFINNLYDDTERLKRLVNRLLEQARADSLQTTSERTDIFPIVQQLASAYARRGLAIEYELAALHLNIAPIAFETVLTNLFENSLQHGANHVKMSVEESFPDCLIRLHDNGAGVSEANQDNVFTPFFTTQREEGGTGLGLGIVQALLQTWKGSVRLIPTEHGACFELTLSMPSAH
ncbi:MAG: HAMP domain-containing sensor histidine kinase [Leucothrix sp.]